MKKIIITIIISIITITILLGFINRNPKKEVVNTADIVYSIDEISKNLKSVGNLGKRQQDIICATSKGLIEIDVDGNINPALAESVDINHEGLEYVFKIRDDIYWSDGSKITAEDIVSFFRQVITEEDEISALLNVFGVKEYINSDKLFDETVAISAIDNSVKIRLNTKDDNFLRELSKPQYRIRKNVLFWEDIDRNYSSLPYSGYYCIKNISNNEVILERSAKADKELAQTIHLVKDESVDSALAAFEIGNRDIVINPPSSQLTRLKSEGKLVTLPSNEAMYLAFNVDNNNFSNRVKNEIYRLMCEAIEEYQNNNNILIELAECSYFREDKDDLTKLQSRNVMVNSSKEEESIKKIVLVAQESLQNKDLVNFLISWFESNTDITLVVNLVSSNSMNSLSEKNYYDIALVNVYAKLDDELFNTISNFIPNNLKQMLINSNTNAENEELFATIEEDLFNNYRILPLIFYNDSIAVSKKVNESVLDGNGNIDFGSIRK